MEEERGGGFGSEQVRDVLVAFSAALLGGSDTLLHCTLGEISQRPACSLRKELAAIIPVYRAGLHGFTRCGSGLTGRSTTAGQWTSEGLSGRTGPGNPPVCWRVKTKRTSKKERAVMYKSGAIPGTGALDVVAARKIQRAGLVT